MTVDEVVRMEVEAVGSCRLVSASVTGADSDEEIHFIVYETDAVEQNGFSYFQRRYTVVVNGVRSTSMILSSRSNRIVSDDTSPMGLDEEYGWLPSNAGN